MRPIKASEFSNLSNVLIDLASALYSSNASKAPVPFSCKFTILNNLMQIKLCFLVGCDTVL
jgi:hypothetical protein